MSITVQALRSAYIQFQMGMPPTGFHHFQEVCRTSKDDEHGVYGEMWKIKGGNTPEAGRNCFHDANGLSSTHLEKAQAIANYLHSKGLETFEGSSTRTLADRAAAGGVSVVNEEYVATCRHWEGVSKAARDFFDGCFLTAPLAYICDEAKTALGNMRREEQSPGIAPMQSRAAQAAEGAKWAMERRVHERIMSGKINWWDSFS